MLGAAKLLTLAANPKPQISAADNVHWAVSSLDTLAHKSCFSISPRHISLCLGSTGGEAPQPAFKDNAEVTTLCSKALRREDTLQSKEVPLIPAFPSQPPEAAFSTCAGWWAITVLSNPPAEHLANSYIKQSLRSAGALLSLHPCQANTALQASHFLGYRIQRHPSMLTTTWNMSSLKPAARALSHQTNISTLAKGGTEKERQPSNKASICLFPNFLLPLNCFAD